MLYCRENIFTLQGAERMFIRYYQKGGSEYAEIRTSKRIDGKVRHERTNLGRVINKEKGVFQNRNRGVFVFTPEGGYQDAYTDDLPTSDTESPLPDRSARLAGRELEPVDFGDTFFVTEYIKQMGLYEILEGIIPNKKDTVLSLLLYKIIEDKKASMHCLTWWLGNYASFLFPNASLASQDISRCLESLASQTLQQSFFKKYLDLLYGNRRMPAILIDSTGLQSAGRMQMVQVSNHNGDVNREVRLIYVVDRDNHMPVYFRYVQGNIIDSTTLVTTYKELKQFGVDVRHAIVDAGYFTEGNAAELLSNGIPFICRVRLTLKLVTGLMGDSLEGVRDIESSKYAMKYANRLVYIKKMGTEYCGHAVYLYFGVDSTMKDMQKTKVMFELLESGKSASEIDIEIMKLGMFCLFSAEDLDEKDILPLYYTRQLVEQTFDVAKNYADILPLRVANEKTLSGHLFLCFIATAIVQHLQKAILEKKISRKLNPIGVMMSLRNHKSKVFENALVPYEPAVENNELYKLFKITVPKEIRLTAKNRQNHDVVVKSSCRSENDTVNEDPITDAL